MIWLCVYLYISGFFVISIMKKNNDGYYDRIDLMMILTWPAMVIFSLAAEIYDLIKKKES